MSVALSQKILLVIVRTFVVFVWVIDVLTNFDLKRVGVRLAKSSVYLLALIFTVFIGYTYSTGYVQKIAESYLSFSTRYVEPARVEIKNLPILVQKVDTPKVTAVSYLVADTKTSRVLYSYNENEKLPPASTAKLLTALVALDIYTMDEVLVVPEACTKIESTKAWFTAGERFTVKDLVYSMLIGSAGDSACVLATGKVPYEDFVRLMNRKASLIGLGSSRFSNPIGLDDIDGQNYSTAFDLYTLSKAVMENSVIRDAVKNTSYPLKSVSGKFAANIFTTNQLLWEIPNTLGIKTGTTTNAGEVFIYDYTDEKKNLVIVVMGSKDRFTDTRKILNWALQSYSWDKQYSL